MTSRKSMWTPFRAALLVLLASVVGVQACGLESPVAPVAPNASAEVPDVELPAPQQSLVSLKEAPTFTPFTVAPSITNREEVVAAMIAAYPPLLREAGIGGTVRVYFFINESGKAEDVRIDQSSGHEALDEAAVAVARVYDFTPARNGDTPVPVWVSFPITFQTRLRGSDTDPNRGD